MAIQMIAQKQNSAHQVCARGWQDYLLETQFFMGESRVDDCLKGFSPLQLAKLGLSEGDVKKVHAG